VDIARQVQHLPKEKRLRVVDVTELPADEEARAG
jgi:hypothetical protein